jgi:hypothetical protein
VEVLTTMQPLPTHSFFTHSLTHSLTCSLNSSSKQTRGCSSSARPLPAFAILPVHLFHFRPKNLSALICSYNITDD